MIYAFLPHKSFYHSTVQYEESVRTTEASLLKEIAVLLQNNIERNLGSAKQLSDWAVGRVTCRDLKIASDEVTVLVFVLMSHEKPMKSMINPRFRITFNLTPHVIIGGEDLKTLEVDEASLTNFVERIRRVATEMPSLDVAALLAALFKVDTPFRQRLDPSGVSYDLHMPVPLSQRFQQYSDALDGFPTGLKGNLSRMLYLSAVTIATSFGDILPITSLSRTLVTTQSILGVVLIGLFLNAIAQGRG